MKPRGSVPTNGRLGKPENIKATRDRLGVPRDLTRRGDHTMDETSSQDLLKRYDHVLRILQPFLRGVDGR